MRHASVDQLTSYGRLNGTNQHASISPALSLEFVGADAIGGGCWIKSGVPDSTTSRSLLGFRGTDGAGAILQMQLEGSGGISRVICGGQTSGSTFSITYASNTRNLPNFFGQWHFIYVENDFSAGRQRVYLNGRLLGDIAATFTNTTVQGGVGAASFIGANSVGTVPWSGNIRDVFLRRGRLTAAQVFELFTKSEMPRDTYHWPCDDAFGNSLTCLFNGVNVPAFNATLQNGNNVFSFDVPKPPRIADRVGGNCLLFSGLAGFYINQTDGPYDLLRGRRFVGASVWAFMTGQTTSAQSRYPFLLISNAGNAALVIQAQTAGNINFGGRSTGADTFQSVATDSPSVMPTIGLNQWYKYDMLIDYRDKIIEGYVNGICVARTPAAVFAEDSFQVLRGAQGITIGASTQLWPGKVDDVVIFHASAMPSRASMREWYLKGQRPAEITPVIDIDCEDFGPNLIDKSNGFVFTPSGIVAPYGLHPLSYMP